MTCYLSSGTLNLLTHSPFQSSKQADCCVIEWLCGVVTDISFLWQINVSSHLSVPMAHNWPSHLVCVSYFRKAFTFLLTPCAVVTYYQAFVIRLITSEQGYVRLMLDKL